MTLNSASVTMLAACAARATHAERLGDSISPLLVTQLPAALEKQAILDRASRGMFSRSIVVRTLHFRERVSSALAVGSNLVILSHGLDFHLADDSALRGVRVFVVDHPDSQRFAREVVASAGLTLPVSFVPHDLAKQPERLVEALQGAGFAPDRPTVVLWEGATYYLEPANVLQVLETLAAHCKRLDVFADFLNEGGYFANGSVASAGVGQSLSFVASLGEPWIGFFQQAALSERLHEFGYRSVECVDRSNVEENVLNEREMQSGMMFFLEAHK